MSCWGGREGVLCYLSVSNIINIITYPDVWHAWRGRGGAGGVEGLLGRMGIGGGDGWFSSMLTIGHTARDTKNYVKSLVTSHNAAILENVCRVTIYFSRPSAILENLCRVTIYFPRPSAILENLCRVTISLLLSTNRRRNAFVILSYRLIFAIECDQCECCTQWPWPKFSSSEFKWLFWQINAGRCKHYYCHQIRSQVFAIVWHHCECCTLWPWPTFSGSRILKCEYLENGWS